MVPRYGMNTLSLRYGGKALLRTPESLAAFLQLPEGYGTPPLLPANRTKDGLIIFEGKAYQLPINDRSHTHKHGSVHLSPFAVTGQTASVIEGCLENYGALYPFPFRMRIQCRLDEHGYHQKFTVCNTGTGNMPIIFAIHAAFVAPATCRVPIRQIWLADARCMPTGELGPLPPELVPYASGTAPDGSPVGFCCPSVGQRVQIDDFIYHVSPQFTQWVVWNGNGHQGFLCVEPQSAPSNALANPGQAMVLSRGESISFITCIHKKAEGNCCER